MPEKQDPLDEGTPDGSVARLPLEDSVAFQVRRVHLAFSRLLEARLSQEGVKPGHWYYLRALGLEGRLTQRELSEMTKVTETTSVPLLKGMEEAGLISRERDESDRRRVYVSLTEEGRALERRVLTFATELNETATEGLSDLELSEWLAALSSMADNLEKSFANVGEMKNGGAKKAR